MRRRGRDAGRAVRAIAPRSVRVVPVRCGDAAATQVICADHARLKAFKKWFDIGHASGDDAQILYQLVAQNCRPHTVREVFRAGRAVKIVELRNGSCDDSREDLRRELVQCGFW